MTMSFEEKSAWISLVITSAVFGNYMLDLLALRGADIEVAREQVASMLTFAVIAIVVMETILHSVLAASNHYGAELGADERDKLIKYRANEWGYTVLAVVVVIAIVQMILTEISPDIASYEARSQIPFFFAHVLMLGFVVSEIVRFAGQVILYRMDA